jgi:hypothetical protein
MKATSVSPRCGSKATEQRGRQQGDMDRQPTDGHGRPSVLRLYAFIALRRVDLGPSGA